MTLHELRVGLRVARTQNDAEGERAIKREIRHRETRRNKVRKPNAGRRDHHGQGRRRRKARK